MALSEADTKAKLIEPNLLQEYGWEEDFLTREYKITQDRFFVEGEDYKRLKTRKFADYVLEYENTIISVLEAKAENEDPQKYLNQVQDYSRRLDVPIAYISNGHQTFLYDRRGPKTQEVDRLLKPEEIFEIFKDWKSLRTEDIDPITHPRYIDSAMERRAYQETAVKKIVENIVKGKRRNLLTMATGTGKTYVAFQAIWKLVKSGCLSKVLFLTDRTFLRDDAYNRDFKPFGDGREIIKHKNFNKNRDIYFSTYQTLYADNFYKEIPRDFFDLIVIDECHRSRYKDWGNILDHFDSAYHLGMTATPRREDNIDVYDYFGEPVFEYSLGQAIEDGFLVPYKIYKTTTNLYKKGLNVNEAEEVIYDDEIDPEEIKDYYEPTEYERTVKIPDQVELLSKKVVEILEKTDPYGKTVVFCTDMAHAQEVKDKLNKIKGDEDYATRIVSEEKDNLSQFRDKEMTQPVIATTVDLLSTGVDIPHLQNIVFMRTISSQVLFKQIIGRGSRLFEGKGFFRIIDFTNATRLIDKWDIPEKPEQPKQPEEPKQPFDKLLLGVVTDEDSETPVSNVQIRANIGRWSKTGFTNKDGSFEMYQIPSNDVVRLTIKKEGYRKRSKKVAPQESESETPYIIKLKKRKREPQKIKVKGINVFVEEKIEIEMEGNKLSFAEYEEFSGDNIRERIHDTEELREIWIDEKKKSKFIRELEKRRVNIDMIKSLGNMGEHDSFDVIAHLAFDAPLLTRQDRVKHFLRKNRDTLKSYNEEIRDGIFRVLDKYEHRGEENLSKKVFMLPKMYETKESLKENFPKGLDGFIKFVRGHIYAFEPKE